MRPEPVNPFEPPPAAEPPRPYALGVKVMLLPQELPASVTATLGPAGGRAAEGGGLLYGCRGGGGEPDTVCGFVIPAQNRTRRNYQIPREAIAAASALTREYGWVALGQVHTHPGRSVEHSWYDDRNAISAKAMSFVAPHYGADPGHWLADIGVHEFQTDWWHLLSVEQASARVALADVPLTTFDLRPQATTKRDEQ